MLIELLFRSRTLTISILFSHQCQALKDVGKNGDNMPMVKVRDVIEYMPQLMYMVQAQEQPASKRARIS